MCSKILLITIFSTIMLIFRLKKKKKKHQAESYMEAMISPIEVNSMIEKMLHINLLGRQGSGGVDIHETDTTAAYI